MDLIFNELAFNNKPSTVNEAICLLDKFAKTCSTAEQVGFVKVRILSDFWNSIYFNNESIFDFFPKLPKTQASFLRSYIRKPYIAEGNEIEDDKFIQNKYYIDYKEFENIEVIGLAYCSFFSTIGISLSTHSFWDNIDIKILEIKDTQTNKLIIKHISIPEHLKLHDDWLTNKRPITLIKSNLKPIDKKIKLRDDHGKDILFEHSQKLIQSEFVVQVINSLPFNPSERNYIRKCYPNGQIEIVLTKSDEGFGIKIQTTGSNIRETEAIGKLLQKKYEK